jgi:hypothetical protein
MRTHTGVLGEFRKFLCYTCNKTIQKWFLHCEPARSFLASPCPTCGKPAFLLGSEQACVT